MKKVLKNFFGNTFSAEPFVNSYVANFFGLQIFRFFFGKLLYNLKFIYLNKKKTEVDHRGYVLIENFLPDDKFDQILNEIKSVLKDPVLSTNYNGYGVGVDVKHVYLDDKIKSVCPNLYDITNNDKIKNLFSNYELKNNINIVAKVEELKSKNNSGEDLSKIYHYDTYFNTFKAWLFLQDVNLENGPLYYVDFSHKISLRKVFGEWKASLQYSLLKNKKDWKNCGASPSETPYYDKISKKFTVKKNTFLFANTHALHRRGDAKPNTERNTIHFYTRESPFKIFFG